MSKHRRTTPHPEASQERKVLKKGAQIRRVRETNQANENRWQKFVRDEEDKHDDD